MRCHSHKHLPRSGSVYVAVTGTAILVSLIGFTALHLSRLELRQTTSLHERSHARQLAQSSVELALAILDEDPDWRTHFTHGIENTRTPNGAGETLRFRLLDPLDGNLANDTAQEVLVEGIGRAGDSEYRYRITCAPGAGSEQIVIPDPPTSFDQPSGTEVPYGIPNDNGVGQYFNPTVPAEASNYTITSIDVKIGQDGANSGEMSFALYYAGPDQLPDDINQPVIAFGTQLEKNFPASPNWYRIPLIDATDLTLGTGFVLMLTDSGKGTMGTIVFAEQPGATLLLTNPSSTLPQAGYSLLYRVNDQYTIPGSGGAAEVVQGSWQRVAAP
jgi:hypothetical protein